jgi:rubrerythrin
MSDADHNPSMIRAWKEKMMTPDNIECSQSCRNTCGMLTEAMHDETEMVQFYERLMNECTYPDVHSFVRELVEEKSRTILRINQKLNELRDSSMLVGHYLSIVFS